MRLAGPSQLWLVRGGWWCNRMAESYPSSFSFPLSHLISGKRPRRSRQAPGSRVWIDRLSPAFLLNFLDDHPTTLENTCARLPRSSSCCSYCSPHIALRLSRALLSSPWHAISSTPPATRTFTALLVILSAANWYFKYSTQIDFPTSHTSHWYQATSSTIHGH
jgi:hypothetical protein